MLPHEYIVEDVSLGNNEWKICRMSDLHYSVETFATEKEALNARTEQNFAIMEY